MNQPDPADTEASAARDGRIHGTCTTCGLPGHRYGSTDPEHTPSMSACVNSLLAALSTAEAKLAKAEAAT